MHFLCNHLIKLSQFNDSSLIRKHNLEGACSTYSFINDVAEREREAYHVKQAVTMSFKHELSKEETKKYRWELRFCNLNKFLDLLRK